VAKTRAQGWAAAASDRGRAAMRRRRQRQTGWESSRSVANAVFGGGGATGRAAGGVWCSGEACWCDDVLCLLCRLGGAEEVQCCGRKLLTLLGGRLLAH
jgi:hypothetical protein